MVALRCLSCWCKLHICGPCFVPIYLTFHTVFLFLRSTSLQCKCLDCWLQIALKLAKKKRRINISWKLKEHFFPWVRIFFKVCQHETCLTGWFGWNCLCWTEMKNDHVTSSLTSRPSAVSEVEMKNADDLEVVSGLRLFKKCETSSRKNAPNLPDMSYWLR